MTPKEKIYTALAAFVASATSVFAPLLTLFLAVGTFLFFDFVAAIAVTIHQRRGFDWSLIINTIPKALLYFVIVSAVFYVEVSWLPGTHLAQLACVLVCRRELKSINRHSKVVFKEDILSTVINALKNKK